ncbi:MAG: hypothetical protein NVSMB9_12770 [Isosphaeraceae bacterium]
MESPSVVTLTPVLVGRFVRLDYNKGYQGKPREGSLVVGFDSKSGEIYGHGNDTWHIVRSVLACKVNGAEGPIAVRGLPTARKSRRSRGSTRGPDGATPW